MKKAGKNKNVDGVKPCPSCRFGQMEVVHL
jgi:hypothetical protein